MALNILREINYQVESTLLSKVESTNITTQTSKALDLKLTNLAGHDLLILASLVRPTQVDTV